MSMQQTEYYTTSTQNSLSATKEPVRLFTQYYINHSCYDAQTTYRDLANLKKQPIFQLHIYTESDVFLARVFQANLNRQLKWNEKSFDLLKSSLNGQNKQILVQFNAEGLKFRLFNEINENSIRVLLFQTEAVRLFKDPIKHAQSMINMASAKTQERLSQLKTEKQNCQINIDRIQAIGRQVTEQHEFQMNMIKDKFLLVINEVKKRLRPHFGIQQKREQDESQDSKTRTLYRLKQRRSNSRQENLLNLFD